MKRLSFLVLLSLLMIIPAFSADVDGTWTATVSGRRGPQDYTFTFKADGATLTGTVGTQFGDTDILDGKIDGDKISFVQKLDFGPGITINYTGVVSGAEIKMTREVQGRGGPSEFVAKKKM